MLEFVLNCSLPYLPHERRLAHRSCTQFSPCQGRPFTKSCIDFPHSRSVLLDDGVIDVVTQLHGQHLHAGADAVALHAAQHYHGIKGDEVSWLLPFCLPCQDEIAAASAHAPLQPIELSFPFECVQIDLINRGLTPDNGYTWILHAKNDFSKVTALYPLHNCEALTVAVAFRNWIMAYSLPRIVQCDNGAEFQGESAIATILFSFLVFCISYFNILTC